MDFGIVHPVPLAVNDVVPQLHVLDDLGDLPVLSIPARRAILLLLANKREAPEGGQPALQLDRATDVLRIAFAARFFDVCTDCVQFRGQILDVLRTQVGVCLDVSDSHEIVFLSNLDGAVAGCG